jgi:hypothetical protein
MSIKQNGGVFGRNPTFNDVTIEGDLIINGEVFTGLDFQGSWNASTNSPALASSVGTNGEFYIVSVAGTTDLNGITNWGIGDWAIFNGTAWQRVEGGADGNFNDVTVAGTLGVTGEITANGGIALGDSDQATFGAGDDLKLYHTGSHSYIDESGTGNLYIGSNNGAGVYIQGSGETLASFVDDGAVTLYHDSNPKLATTATGIDVTGNISLNSGSGIDFSATPGTGTSELFDDYEEGTWTPTVIGSTTAGTATYSQQVGTYTKVGNLCYAQLWVIFSSFTGAGEMRISALPFTPESGSYENHTGSVVLESITLPVGTVQVAPRAFNSQTYLGLTAVKDNDTSSSVDCDSAGQILISITYRTT